MAKSINKVILVGNLGKDPETRQAGNSTVSNFSVATTSAWKDKTGDWQEETTWHDIVVWGRLAEVAGEYLRKGSKVYVEGAISKRTYEDKDGNTRYVTEVKARELVFLDSPSGETSGRTSHQSPSAMEDVLDDLFS